MSSVNTEKKITTNHYQDNLDHTLFAWSKQKGINPIDCVHAEGLYIIDRDGKKYMDFSSQLMNVNLGHNHPYINNAIKEQLDKVAYVFPGISTDPRGALGKKIAQIAPKHLNKTFFTSGGSDSNENAIILARLYTGKQKIISKYRSYHGSTYGSLAATGDPRKLGIDANQMPGVVHIEDPYCYRCPWNQSASNCNYECVSHLERIIQFEGPETIAAILLEGESGTSGCIKYPEHYWKKVEEIAKKNNILTISDEVMSGFGRCGEWFAFQRFNVEPDIVVMAKGISSGYMPLGGVLVSDKIADFFNDKPLPIGLTYSGHALACSAGSACMDVYENENILENVKHLGLYLEHKLKIMKNNYSIIGDCRNTGLLGVIELVKDKKSKEPLIPWNAKGDDLKLTTSIIVKLREKGLLTFVRWNWIFIAPPLNITEPDLNEGLTIIESVIQEIEVEIKN